MRPTRWPEPSARHRLPAWRAAETQPVPERMRLAGLALGGCCAPPECKRAVQQLPHSLLPSSQLAGTPSMGKEVSAAGGQAGESQVHRWVHHPVACGWRQRAAQQCRPCGLARIRLCAGLLQRAMLLANAQSCLLAATVRAAMHRRRASGLRGARPAQNRVHTGIPFLLHCHPWQ